ncbi:hypothetical protein H6P81_002464 [Aristolochia fimbriata]|uniref:MADS-box domain-containing protein n=1 Tax=Aristolochia fimbriata TaxID=158543 RepID=A0AAV7FB05_ARIFI|nr:hypothetical protein H6P81_002464 [Aristolochia fimbriata]
MGAGKGKIERAFMEEKTRREVTFSKRRQGLFKRAGELSLLTGARVAILVLSPAGKQYAFGDLSLLQDYLRTEHYSAAGDEASTDNITTSTAAATAEEEWEMGDRFLIDDALSGGDGTGQPIQNDGSETPISAVFSGGDEASTDDATSTVALPNNLLAAAEEEEEKWEMEDRFLIDDALYGDVDGAEPIQMSDDDLPSPPIDGGVETSKKDWDLATLLGTDHQGPILMPAVASRNPISMATEASRNPISMATEASRNPISMATEAFMEF